MKIFKISFGQLQINFRTFIRSLKHFKQFKLWADFYNFHQQLSPKKSYKNCSWARIKTQVSMPRLWQNLQNGVWTKIPHSNFSWRKEAIYMFIMSEMFCVQHCIEKTYCPSSWEKKATWMPTLPWKIWPESSFSHTYKRKA